MITEIIGNDFIYCFDLILGLLLLLLLCGEFCLFLFAIKSTITVMFKCFIFVLPFFLRESPLPEEPIK